MTEGAERITKLDIGGYFIMMRSLYAGVSGLKTHQTRMDVIGNNIANVNTVAYKSMSMTFSELMYQTTQSASGPNGTTGTAGINAKQIGLGVKGGAINTSITTPGGTQTTGNPFDMKISGNAFFIVNSGQGNYYTRDGSFYVDGGGNLAMQSNGYNVMGWGIDENTGLLKTDSLTKLQVLNPKYLSYDAEATTKSYISGIIDQYDKDTTSLEGKPVTLEFYDSAGYTYTAKFSIKALGTKTTRDYSVVLSDVKDADGNSVIDTTNMKIGNNMNYMYASPIKLKQPSTITGIANSAGADDGFSLADGSKIKYSSLFDANGKPTKEMDTIAAAYGYTTNNFLNQLTTDSAPATVKMETLLKEAAAGTATNITQLHDALSGASDITGIYTTVLNYSAADGKFIGVNDSTTNKSFTLGLNYTNFSNIQIDLSTTSNVNNSGTSTVNAKRGTVDDISDGAGRKIGNLNGISVENTGKIYASYSNGQSRLLGQIAVSEFANASGLEKEGDNLYSATSNSGDPTIKEVKSLDGGAITTGTLEMSNVDLSSEFTEMITTQRGFQANSRIITVSDTLIEELVNLKR